MVLIRDTVASGGAPLGGICMESCLGSFAVCTLALISFFGFHSELRGGSWLRCLKPRCFLTTVPML